MDQIKKAAAVLKQGGVIAYPTETVYGLGADIFNAKAVRKVFKLKGRNFKKPLSIAVADFKMLKKLVFLNKANEKILKKLLPGPYTVLLSKKKVVSNLLTAGSKLVGIRMPDHKIARAIIKKAGFPITATSANLSGQKEIIKYQNIKLAVDFTIRGQCRYKEPSTIIDLVNKKIIRMGTGLQKARKIIM